MTTEKVQVRHDCPIRLRLIDKASQRVVDESDTTAASLDGAITVRSIMFNALAMSGGTRWVHPTTGEHYPAGLAIDYAIADESFILKDGEPCPCTTCERKESHVQR